MLKIIIIDDEEQACQTLKSLLDFYCDDIEVLAMAHDIESGARLIVEYNPDLVFLDIQMPGGSGFDLLKRIKPINFTIIFVTAYDFYALEAIKYSALDYLLKPINPDELIKAINKAERIERDTQYHLRLESLSQNLVDNQPRKLILNTANIVYSVDIVDIVRFEAEQNYTHIFFQNREQITAAKTLKWFDELLSGSHFFRVHQSHLVNLYFIDRIDKVLCQLILKDNSRIPFASRKKDLLIDALQNLPNLR
ncbi:MAG: two-component system, LytTR family, response regulator [Epulopiscium sp.]|jgi:two-component system LytT family response regulator|nr:two-component system, LytTR family, response regulator [Candidatus Epulonipiscium sp.]MDK2905560.1 two-component system, LytTR family, response regulator [Eubacteriaceae bacterium]